MLKPKPDKALSFIAFSCAHSPLTDPEAAEFVYELCKEHQPDLVVNLGDQYEADSASRWPSEAHWSIDDELMHANEFQKNIRLASPNSKRYFLPGNHDDNFISLGRINPKLRDRCDWRTPQYTRKGVWLNEELLTNWTIPCDYVRHRTKGCLRIGSVFFTHGYECDVNSDRNQATYFCWQYGLLVSGHTHRPTPGPARRCMLTQRHALPFWYLNAGALTSMDCDYMKRKNQGMWGQAVIMGWTLPINSPRSSKTWDAECILFRMYDEPV